MGVESRCRFGCKNQKAQPWHLLCPTCWAELPKRLQDAVWHEYKRERGSAAHLGVIRECYEFFHAKERDAKGANPLAVFEFSVNYEKGFGYVAKSMKNHGVKSVACASAKMACEELARKILGPGHPVTITRLYKGIYAITENL